MDLSRFQEALDDYGRVSGDRTGDTAGHAAFNAGNALLSRGLLTEAMASYKDAEKKGGNPDGIGQNLFALGQIWATVEGLEYEVEAPPEQESGRILLKFLLPEPEAIPGTDPHKFLIFGRAGNTGNTGGPGLIGDKSSPVNHSPLWKLALKAKPQNSGSSTQQKKPSGAVMSREGAELGPARAGTPTGGTRFSTEPRRRCAVLAGAPAPGADGAVRDAGRWAPRLGEAAVGAGLGCSPKRKPHPGTRAVNPAAVEEGPGRPGWRRCVGCGRG